eukprot:3663524-Rhodomonas_salina.2
MASSTFGSRYECITAPLQFVMESRWREQVASPANGNGAFCGFLRVSIPGEELCSLAYLSMLTCDFSFAGCRMKKEGQP